MRTCPKCRSVFNDTVNFCLNDGTPLVNGFELPPNKAKRGAPFVAAIVAAVAAAAVVGLLAIGAIVFAMRQNARDRIAQTTANQAANLASSNQAANRTLSNQVVPTQSSGAQSVAASNKNQTPENPAFPVRETASFGEKGIGGGQFSRIEAMATDQTGKLYVSDASSEISRERIQIFDTENKFLTQWKAPSESASPIDRFLFDRSSGALFATDGTGLIRIDPATGKKLGNLIRRKSGIFMTDYPLEWDADDAALALDGTLWVLVGNGGFLHLKPDGKRIAHIKDARDLASFSGEFNKIAVDGAGNIYTVSSSDCYVFKFSPEAKFVDRFGGKSKDRSGLTPGLCESEFDSLVVDGKGRIFVGDSALIHVFKADGSAIAAFKAKSSVSSLFVTDKNELWAATGEILTRYELPAE